VKEQRDHPRLSIPIEAEYRLPDGSWCPASLVDLSGSGAGLLVEDRLATGTPLLSVRFSLPAEGDADKVPLDLAAEVVRCVEEAAVGRESSYRLGVRFLDPGPDQLRSIQQFVFRRLTKGDPQLVDIPLEKRRIDFQQAIAVRYERFNEFESEISTNLSTEGMFLRSADPKPPGTVFSFQFQLGDDFALIEGRAEVIWTRREDQGPRRPAGMGVRFLTIDETSRNVIKRLVKTATEKASEKARARREQEKKPRLRAANAGRPQVASVSGAVKHMVGTVAAGLQGRNGRAAAPGTVVAMQPVGGFKSGAVREGAAAPTRVIADEVQLLRDELERLRQASTEREQGFNAKLAESAITEAKLKGRLEEIESSLAAAEEGNANLEQRLEAARGENEALREELENLQGLNARLTESSTSETELESRLQEVESSLGVAEKKSAEVAHRLEVTRGEKEALREELENLLQASTEREQGLNAKLAESASSEAELESRLQEAENSLRATEEGNADLAQRLEETTGERESLREELENLRQASTEREQGLNTKLAELMTSEAQHKNRIEEIKSSLDGAERRNGSLTRQLEETVGEKESLLKKLQERENAGSNLAGLREELKEAQKELEKEVLAKSGVENRLLAVESSLAEVELERESISSRLQEVTAERDELRQGLDSLSADENAVAEWQRQVEEAAAEAAVAEERIGKLEASLTEAQQAREQSVQNLEEVEKARDELRDELRFLTSETENLRKTLAGSEATVEKVRAEAGNLEMDLRGELEESSRSETELRGRVSELEGSLESAQQELAVVREEAAQSRGEFQETEARLLEQLESAQGAESELGGRVSELEGSLESAQRDLAGVREEAERAEGELRSRLVETESSRVEAEARREGLARDLAAVKQDREALQEEIEKLQVAGRSLYAELVRAKGEAVGGEEEAAQEVVERIPLAATFAAAKSGGSGRHTWRGAGLLAAGLLLGLLIPLGFGKLDLSQGSEVTVSTRGTAEAEPAEPSPEVVRPVPEQDQKDIGGDQTEALEPAVTVPVEVQEPVPELPSAGEAVRAWARAWSEQRVDDYLSSYSKEFVPPNDLSRSEWEASRRERLLAPASITLTLEALSEEEIATGRTRVTFDQSYETATYSDKVRKTVLLVWEDESWKIAVEESEPLS
jgi:uncharacterized protein (TIGR02266 family)